jgi:hypothetical protein
MSSETDMDPKLLEMLFIAVGNGVALYIGAYLARSTAELADRRRAEREEKAQLHREKREALLERLALQRRAFDEYTRLIVKWSTGAPAASAPGARPAPPSRAREGNFAADQDSIALYAQMVSAFGNRKFAEQTGATLQAARAGRDSVQVLPFSVQIVSACYQEMIRAMSDLEKEIGLAVPRSPARPFLADEELAKETTRLFSRDAVRASLDLGMVDQVFERVRQSQAFGDMTGAEADSHSAGQSSAMDPDDR